MPAHQTHIRTCTQRHSLTRWKGQLGSEENVTRTELQLIKAVLGAFDLGYTNNVVR